MQALHEHIGKDGFRLRGTRMSRIDGFSDVVFGFALTLLVVAIEVPHTYDELHALLLGFFPFFICFSLFFTVWWAHFRFFRRFGLHDTTTIVLNAGLLFTVLFYVYPMKFLFGMAVSSQPQHVFSNVSQIRELMVVYGLGFAAIYLIFAAMYYNAWRQRARLQLNPLEKTLTLSYILDNVGVGSVGLVCCLLACILPPAQAGKAGFFFFAIGIWKTCHGFIGARYARRAAARTSPEERGPLPHSM